LRTILLSTLTILAFSACSDNTQDKKTQNIMHEKISAVKEAKAVVKQAVEKVEKTNTTTSQIVSEAKSGESLYVTKCSSCHGKHAEKSALNSSQIIAGWESTKIQNALSGYKNGTYGGKMKGIMKGQVIPLNEGQTERLSTYISSL